jgi:hypothetical protein
MAEGLSPTEVGKEIAAHAEHHRHADKSRHDALTITEAVLLSVVTILAAWSGYSAAKWNTESRVTLAEASAARVKAGTAGEQALTLRNFDASTFNAWFSAYAVHNQVAMRIAERRFRPEFRTAFEAWRATRPETNPSAPRGPTYMPQYRQPGLARAASLEREADDLFDKGSSQGNTSDKYIRTTVFLASVLFLIGISTHFPLRGVRYGLVGVSAVLLVLSLIQLAQLPRPPA